MVIIILKYRNNFFIQISQLFSTMYMYIKNSSNIFKRFKNSTLSKREILSILYNDNVN